MIIAIEGGDAVGKATQSKILAERLHGTRFTFPDYSTPAGKAILGHFKSEWSATRYMEIAGAQAQAECDSMVFQCLQTVNRLELLPEIHRALARGPVVFDRWSVSGLVYGTLDGLDPEWYRLINASLPEPDLWILLDAPVAVGFERRPERRDRIESNREYLEKVREGYSGLFQRRNIVNKTMSGQILDRKSWYVVDAVGTVDEVAARIWSLVKS